MFFRQIYRQTVVFLLSGIAQCSQEELHGKAKIAREAQQQTSFCRAGFSFDGFGDGSAAGSKGDRMGLQMDYELDAAEDVLEERIKEEIKPMSATGRQDGGRSPTHRCARRTTTPSASEASRSGRCRRARTPTKGPLLDSWPALNTGSIRCPVFSGSAPGPRLWSRAS